MKKNLFFFLILFPFSSPLFFRQCFELSETPGYTITSASFFSSGFLTRLGWLSFHKAFFDQKLGLIIWSPLAGGLLSGKYSRDVKFTGYELKQLDEASKLSPEYPGWMLERTGGDRQK